MASEHRRVTYFARTNYRNRGERFGIRRSDRFSHTYIIGKTGTGKSTLLRTMLAQDVSDGNGCALFDPHGELVESLLPLIPASRQADVFYLDVPNVTKRWHLNPFAGVAPEQRSLAAAGLVEVFKRIWTDDWGPRLEHLLRNVAFTLLETDGATLGDVPPLLTDKSCRQRLTSNLANDEVRSFWRDEYERYSPAFRAVVIAPLQNKLGALLTNPLLRSILTGTENTFEPGQLMDEGKVLLVNLAKGRIGEGPSSLLGSLLVSQLALAGLERADRPECERRGFFIYIDEFQTVTTHFLVTMLSELRKYRLGLILAHQYLGQLEGEVRDAVLGNAGTLISFRIGAQDAPLIARELSPKFLPDDLISLPNYNIYLRLLVDGEPTKPFSATTLASPDLSC